MMGSATTATVHTARKAHGSCLLCMERIWPGQTYRRWRYFEDGAWTIKVHRTCHQLAMFADFYDDGDGWHEGELREEIGEWRRNDLIRRLRDITAPPAEVRRLLKMWDEGRDD